MFFEAMHPQWQSLLADQRATLESIEKELGIEPVSEGARVQAGERAVEPAGERAAGASSQFLPEPHQVMRAFATDPNETRVLIVGQDPYPTPGHAIGLAFACPMHVKPQPRSLQNIRAELASDLNISPEQAAHIDLAKWAGGGVMLLNRTLTVAPGETHSHLKIGWQTITATAIERLAVLRGVQLVAILWGKPAQGVVGLLEPAIGKANVLAAAHPSPLSARRGFFGSKPFSQVNHLLVEKGLQPIDWIG